MRPTLALAPRKARSGRPSQTWSGREPGPYMNTSERRSPSKSPISGVIPVGTAAASAAVAAPSATAVRRSGSWAAVGDATARARQSRQVSSRPSLAGRVRT